MTPRQIAQLITEDPDVVNEGSYPCPLCGSIGELGFSSYWCSNPSCDNYNENIFPKSGKESFCVVVRSSFNLNDIEECFSMLKGHSGVIVKYGYPSNHHVINVIIAFDDEMNLNEFINDDAVRKIFIHFKVQHLASHPQHEAQEIVHNFNSRDVETRFVQEYDLS